MIFYNGFNLLVDLILCGVVGYFAYRFGFSDGFLEGEKENAPPF